MSNTPNLRLHRERLVYISSLKNREGGQAVNECKTPDLGASKADLAEFHKEELRARRHRQLARTPNSSFVVSTSIAGSNRRGGPHKHPREMVRRSRQCAARSPHPNVNEGAR